MRLKGITVDQLEMTDDLANLITDRFRASNLNWSVGGKQRYSKLLEDSMLETSNYLNFFHIYFTTIEFSMQYVYSARHHE